MTTATKAARPRTPHPEHNGAQHNGAQHNGAQHNGAAAVDAAPAPITETDAALITETAAALTLISETAAALARISETATAGISQTSNVAGDSVTSLIWELTMIVRSVVRLALELFGGVAAEFGAVVARNLDDDQRADLCFGDPTAWV